MSDELLRFVAAPQSSPVWWLLAGLGGLLAAVGWVVAVWVATWPAARLQRVPVLREVHHRVLRRRFARRVSTHLARHRDARHRDGHLDGPAAAAAVSRTLRAFLGQATGRPAAHLHPPQLAPHQPEAAALLAALGDARFDAASTVDVAATGDAVRTWIRTWAPDARGADA